MRNSSIELERVRETVSRLTGARFQVLAVQEYYPNWNLHPIWFMACVDITEASKIQYLNTLWKEENQIRMESLPTGDTSSWIEQDYGEEGVISTVGVDLANFGDRKFRNKLLKPFPSTKRRVDLQEEIIRRVAEKDDVKMEVRYVGDKGLATFYLDAIVDTSKGDVRMELKAIEKSLHSMKEAWKQVSAL